MRFAIAHLLASITLVASDIKIQQDVDYNALYPMLGKNSFDELKYNFTIDVDEDCEYKFTVKWSHSPEFPVGGPDTCLPSVIADYDGNSMLESRWFYEEFPSFVEEATGFNHLSLDWNPCGHPTGGFLSPHYDLHFYRVTPAFRATQMNCEVISGTPACWPEQFIESGLKFFRGNRNEAGELINMPKNFVINPNDAVIYMGSHVFDPSLVPETPADWKDPFFVLLTHDADIICVEPMLPFSYALGDQNQNNVTNLTYVDQTDEYLPRQFISTYDATEKFTTVTLVGKSQVCKAEFDLSKIAYENGQTSSGTTVMSHGVFSILGHMLLPLIFTASMIFQS